LTKVSLHKQYILVETETINLADLRNAELRMYYIVEIHDVDSDDIGCIMKEIDGEMQPVKYDTFSKAKVQAALIAKDLPKGKYVHIETVNGSDEC
jgi:ATP-dependent RNA circularization protein (DNA/RNA ligase family)